MHETSPEHDPATDAPRPESPDLLQDMPLPRTRRRRHISIVWLIPLVAAIAAAWMAYDAMQAKGPLVTITMDNAEGIVAGKTKIKFKDVEVGLVESVEFSKDLLHVVVKARMAKSMERYLRSQTLFWVVRARVTPSEVSGLSTLFSGAYIGIQPSKRGKLMSEFTALESPPVLTDERQGRHFLLRSDDLGSLDVGSPVYFHKIKVGQVVSYSLKKNNQVEVKIFIQTPHHERVTRGTRFWNASGLDLAMDAKGVRVEAESLVSMLFGGISFDSTNGGQALEEAPTNAVFKLYPTREKSFETSYDYRERYLLYFNESVRGLAVGAPVEFRGLTIGRVTDIRLQMDPGRRIARIPVIIEIEPERFDILSETDARDKVVPAMLAMGMRAQLKTGSLITGQSFVDLNLYPDLPAGRLTAGGRYPELPTVPSPLEGLLASAQRIMNKLEGLPMTKLTGEMRTTMSDIRGTLGQLRGLMGKAEDLEILPKAARTLDQATSALKQVDETLAPDSQIKTDIARLLKEIGDAARSLRVLADYLERQPDALLFGKEN